MQENIPLTFTRISEAQVTAKKGKGAESSSDSLPNDALSFYLELTPTPPDVNLDTEPKLENERVKKNAKEKGPTITTSPVDALVSVTPTIERKRKDLPTLEYEHVKKMQKSRDRRTQELHLMLCHYLLPCQTQHWSPLP
nr:hypothetical protein [Tanacetum cinerariifolium]